MNGSRLGVNSDYIAVLDFMLSSNNTTTASISSANEAVSSSLYARSREIMGTCVAMRVKVEGMEPKAALQAMEEGRFNEHFE